MEKRNEFIEMHGLYWESDTHEWFRDKTSTNYAQTDNGLNEDALKNIYAFILRDKETGEYDRVLVDGDKNEIIYSTKSLEDLGFQIDKIKLINRFKIK